jgi:hypothetical protein
MPWGLRRQVPMIQMHHAPHLPYNCNHTNKIGVKHTKKWLMLCVQNIWSLADQLDYSSSLYLQKTFHHFSEYGARIHVLNNDTSHTLGARIAQSLQWLQYGLEDWGIVVQFLAGASVLFSKAPRLAIKLTQHPIQWVSGAPFPGKAVGMWTNPLASIQWLRIRGALPLLSIPFDVVHKKTLHLQNT